MPTIFDLRDSVALFSPESYPRTNEEARSMGLAGARNEEMRAMTIAAFRIAQNNTQLSQRHMDAALLEFLVAGSETATRHWIRVARLVLSDGRYQLTAAGIAECQNSLLGIAGSYSTTEAKVQEWQDRMTGGDSAAPRVRTFRPGSWEGASLSPSSSRPMAAPTGLAIRI